MERVRPVAGVLLLASTLGCGNGPPPKSTAAPSARAQTSASSAPRNTPAQAGRAEAPCKPGPLSTAGRLSYSMPSATMKTAGAKTCRVTPHVLGPGLARDFVRIGTGAAGTYACWARDGDHISVRKLDADGVPSGQVVDSLPYPWLRECEVLVGSKGALILVHSGKAVQERRWYGLFVDAEGRLVADVQLDLPAPRSRDAYDSVIATSALSDGGYLLAFGPTGKESDGAPLAFRWLEVGQERPDACAHAVTTKLAQRTYAAYRFSDERPPALLFEAPNRPDSPVEDWYALRPDAELKKLAALPRTPVSSAGQEPEFTLFGGASGLRRMSGWAPGAILNEPAGLDPIDTSAFASDAVAIQANWTGTIYAIVLPITAEEGARILATDCRPT